MKKILFYMLMLSLISRSSFAQNIRFNLDQSSYKYGISFWGGFGGGVDNISINFGTNLNLKNRNLGAFAESGAKGGLFGDIFNQISAYYGWNKTRYGQQFSFNLGGGTFYYSKKTQGGFFGLTQYETSVQSCFDVIAKYSIDYRNNGLGLLLHVNLNRKFSFMNLTLFSQLGWKWK